MKTLFVALSILAIFVWGANIISSERLAGGDPVARAQDQVASAVERGRTAIESNLPMADDSDAGEGSIVASVPPPAGSDTTRYIVNTGGSRLAVRYDCDVDARSSGVMAEGQAVVVLQHGTAQCAGWTYVDYGDGATSWVENRYLAASASPAGG
jgi:hypothetical protein